MRVRLATTEEILARSAGPVRNRDSFDGDRPRPGGLYGEEVFGPYAPTRCGCARATLHIKPGEKCPTCGTVVERFPVAWGPPGHFPLAEPALHPLAHALFALLVEIPTPQITALAKGEKLWILPPEPREGGPLELMTQLEFMDVERDPSVHALTTIEALRALLAEAARRDKVALHDRARRAGFTDLEALFLSAVPVLPSLSRGPYGECREADMSYNAIVVRHQRHAEFAARMPFLVYRTMSASCALSVFNLFDVVPDPAPPPHTLPDTNRSVRYYLETSVGSRLPLAFERRVADVDIPDTPQHRALVEGLGLCIETA